MNEDSALKQIIQELEKCLLEGTIELIVNDRVYAIVKYDPDDAVNELCGGFFVTYFTVPNNEIDEIDVDFYPDGDFDRAAIDLYKASRNMLDQIGNETMLEALRTKNTEEVFYSARVDKEKLLIKYDAAAKAWLFQDEEQGYKFEDKLDEAAKHMLRFSIRSATGIH